MQRHPFLIEKNGQRKKNGERDETDHREERQKQMSRSQRPYRRRFSHVNPASLAHFFGFSDAAAAQLSTFNQFRKGVRLASLRHVAAHNTLTMSTIRIAIRLSSRQRLPDGRHRVASGPAKPRNFLSPPARRKPLKKRGKVGRFKKISDICMSWKTHRRSRWNKSRPP